MVDKNQRKDLKAVELTIDEFMTDINKQQSF